MAPVGTLRRVPDDEPGDEGVSGPPPHPLDRPWVHPTEMFARSGVRRAPRSAPPRPLRGRDAVLALGGGLAGALVMVLALAAAGVLGDGSDAPRARPERAADADTAARLAATAGPAVVGVATATAMGPRRASGVALRDGYVLTTTAAVEGGDSIAMVGADGASHAATVIGRDDLSGLALLHVDGAVTEPAPLASEDSVEVGAWVLALGAGDGMPWVSTGVVSSLGGWTRDGTGTVRAGMISTNAPSGETAHGGALVDRSGHVVGILAGGAGGDGPLVATPISVARQVATQLAEQGWAAHGSLGLQVEDEDEPRGARIDAIEPGGPAAPSDLEPGDVIVAVAGKPVRDTAALVYEVRRRLPGASVELRVRREEETLRITVVLGTIETEAPTSPSPTASGVQPVSAG